MKKIGRRRKHENTSGYKNEIYLFGCQAVIRYLISENLQVTFHSEMILEMSKNIVTA